MTLRVDNIEGASKSYLWYTSLLEPYCQYKGTVYKFIGVIPFEGTDSRLPTSAKVTAEVDNGATADIRLVDPTIGTVAEKTGIDNTSWETVDLGELGSLSSAPSIWEVHIKTSSAAKAVRLSVLEVYH